MSGEWNPVRAIVAEIFDNFEAHADRIVTVARNALPSYTALPEPEFAHGKVVLRGVLKAVSERRPPTEEEIQEAVATAARRARQHIPVEEALRAFQIGVREVFSAFSKQAASRNLDGAVLAEVTDLFWRWVDAVTLPIVVLHRKAELEMARYDQSQRLHFLHSLLFGTVETSELTNKAQVFGLHTDHLYIPFKARSVGTIPLEELELQIASNRSVVLSGLVDDGIAGLALQRPNLRLPGVVMGIGPATHLHDITPAFFLVGRVLDTAIKFHQTGVFALEDIPLYVGVSEEDKIGDVLWHRYIELAGESQLQRRALLSTLASFLDNERDIERTASVLKVHANTVRNRLNRFEEITGARLSRTEELFSVWWALQYDSIRTSESKEPSLPDTHKQPAAKPEEDTKAKPRKRSKKQTSGRNSSRARGKAAR